MKIGDVMTRDVQMIGPEDTLQDAARLLGDIDAGALPVGRHEAVEGILTDRDIIIRAVSEGRDPTVTTVREIMSTDLVCCGAEDDADRIAETMRARRIRRMPVLGLEGRLVGIVALSDIARGAPAEARTPEQELREAAGDKPPARNDV
ncbi:MAG: CBS domain-containing protein [Rhodospirillales bacterium]|nr:CBS domain-containing protein [Rhodospirillales bacterium]